MSQGGMFSKKIQGLVVAMATTIGRRLISMHFFNQGALMNIYQ